MTSTSTTPAAQDGTRPGIEVTTAGLTALARHASTINDQMAALSVRAIAAAARAALPAAAAVGLAWTGRGPSLEPAGLFTAAGQRLGTGPGDDQAAAARLTAAIRDWCGHLNQANQPVWEPLITGRAVFGTALDGEYLLDVAQVLAAAPPAGTCACPPGAHAVTDGVTVMGHRPGCALARPPQEYFWECSWGDGDGEVCTGTLASYAEAFELAHDESLPAPELSPVIRAWDAGYPALTVQAACLDHSPGQDGCWLVRLSVPGEEVTVRVWALSQPFPRLPFPPAGRPAEDTAAGDQGAQLTIAYWMPCRFLTTVPAAQAARILREARADDAAAIAGRIAAGETVTGDPEGTRADDPGPSDLAALALAIQNNHRPFSPYLYDTDGQPDDTDDPEDFSVSITAPGTAGEDAAG